MVSCFGFYFLPEAAFHFHVLVSAEPAPFEFGLLRLSHCSLQHSQKQVELKGNLLTKKHWSSDWSGEIRFGSACEFKLGKGRQGVRQHEYRSRPVNRSHYNNHRIMIYHDDGGDDDDDDDDGGGGGGGAGDDHTHICIYIYIFIYIYIYMTYRLPAWVMEQ